MSSEEAVKIRDLFQELKERQDARQYADIKLEKKIEIPKEITPFDENAKKIVYSMEDLELILDGIPMEYIRNKSIKLPKRPFWKINSNSIKPSRAAKEMKRKKQNKTLSNIPNATILTQDVPNQINNDATTEKNKRRISDSYLHVLEKRLNLSKHQDIDLESWKYKMKESEENTYTDTSNFKFNPLFHVNDKIPQHDKNLNFKGKQINAGPKSENTEDTSYPSSMFSDFFSSTSKNSQHQTSTIFDNSRDPESPLTPISTENENFNNPNFTKVKFKRKSLNGSDYIHNNPVPYNIQQYSMNYPAMSLQMENLYPKKTVYRPLGTITHFINEQPQVSNITPMVQTSQNFSFPTFNAISNFPATPYDYNYHSGAEFISNGNYFSHENRPHQSYNSTYKNSTPAFISGFSSYSSNPNPITVTKHIDGYNESATHIFGKYSHFQTQADLK